MSSRLYKRNERWYADLRDYASVGGRQEALKPKDEQRATKDEDVAIILLAARVKQLEELQRGAHLLGIKRRIGIGPFAERHLILKASEGRSRRGHLKNVQTHLERIANYFGEGRDLASITTVDVGDWVRWMSKQPNKRGGTLTQATMRHALTALSDLFKRAKSEGYCLQNATTDLYHKPTPEQRTAEYWEPWQVALLIQAARTLPHDNVVGGRGNGGRIKAGTYPWIYPLVATAALTGLRKGELLGLTLDDVDLHMNRIFVRPNQHRPLLRTNHSTRTVPIWPQLRDILLQYINEQAEELDVLLFPSHRNRRNRMLGSVDGSLDRIGKRAGIGRARLQVFRHSYISARVQTLDGGQPISLFTVAREVGHSGIALIEQRYGHLVHVPIRSDVVEYRLDHYANRVVDQVALMVS
jgi:integrase